jgi:mannose-1-phosphate guanylyltransferase/mannose-6-phosphate isomerase
MQYSSKIFPVLLAGGSGTRLWPVSRQAFPKQFIDILGVGRSLFQLALERRTLLNIENPWIVVGTEEHRFLLAQQAHEIEEKLNSIILEPIGKNTAPAIALAALRALEADSDAQILIQTGDHVIEDMNQFNQALSDAMQKTGHFCLFGIEPSRVETGYGYLKIQKDHQRISMVEEFVEKPVKEQAMNFVRSGLYLWNSGMFLLDAQAYLDALGEFEPLILDRVRESWHSQTIDVDFVRVERDAFASIPAMSIDHAVMERVKHLEAVRLRSTWDDLGAWNSVASHLPHDQEGNSILGDAILHQCHNVAVRSDERLIAAIGLQDVHIIDTPDALLVAKEDQLQDVKAIVSKLNSDGRSEGVYHKQVARPWGHFKTLVLSEGYQVKEIVVKPGASLSLQLHYHRAEHWVVVDGSALVEVSGIETLLSVNESIYIPIGEKHRLSNPGKVPVRLIEVQSGQYLGEDDIVRFDDKYGRE